jgi:predicted alpha/beta superfamily hydrolase
MYKQIIFPFLLLHVFLTSNTIAQNQIPNVSSGKIERLDSFASKYVSPRNIDIWLPDGYTKTKKYAVLYMHDGQMLYDTTQTWNKQAWEIDETAGKLLADKKVKEFIVVGIWNDAKNRHQDYFPQKPYNDLTTLQKDSITSVLQKIGRVADVFLPNSDNYLKFIVKELKPFIDKKYSVKKNKENTFIAGSSMGALISWYAMCEYPKIFDGAICMSTHWVGTFSVENNPIPAVFLNYLEKKLPNKQTHKIYFDYGNQTLDALYPTLQKKIDILMTNKNWSNKNWVTKFFSGDDHSEKSWQKRVHIPLLFMLGF